MKRLVSFGPINLNDRMQLKRVESSHIVFCRNVIIYFDEDMKKRVVSSFYDNLLPGGYLFIGHSESLHNISRVVDALLDLEYIYREYCSLTIPQSRISRQQYIFDDKTTF